MQAQAAESRRRFAMARPFGLSGRAVAASKNEARDSEKALLCCTSLPPQGQGETWPYQIVW